MLIHAEVLKVARAYKEHLDLIREFVSDALELFDTQKLTELWIEQYRKPEPCIGITPLRNGRAGAMVWVLNIPNFHEILAFLRHKDLNFFRTTSDSIGKADGIRFTETDVDTLRSLNHLLSSVMGMEGSSAPFGAPAQEFWE